MKKYLSLKVLLGGAFLLLPFFVNPFIRALDTATPEQLFRIQELQIPVPKILACFILGNFLFGIYLNKKIHWSAGISYFLIASSIFLTGFGSIQVYPFIYILSAVFAALFFIEFPEYQKPLIYGVSVSGVLCGVYAILQFFNKDPFFSYAPGIETSNPIAFFGQATKFGAFQAMAFGAALGVRWYLPALFILITACMTGSSFTIAACAGVILFFLKELPFGKTLVKYGLFMCLSTAALGLALTHPESPGFFYPHGRFVVWESALKGWFNNNPILGFGLGSFGKIYPVNFQPAFIQQHGEFINAHNDYVQLVFEMGVFGIGVLSLFCVALGLYASRIYWRHERPDSLRGFEYMAAAILINAIGNFPFQLAPMFFLGIISLLIIVSKLKEDVAWRRQTYLL